MTHRPFENLLQDLVKLHPSVVKEAETVAQKVKPKRRITVKVKPAPVVKVIEVHPDVMRTAMELAGGDARRLQICADGSVTVLNRPRTEKPQPNR